MLRCRLRLRSSLSILCSATLHNFVTKNLKGLFIIVFIFIMVNVCVVLLPRLRTDSLIGAIDDVIFGGSL